MRRFLPHWFDLLAVLVLLLPVGPAAAQGAGPDPADWRLGLPAFRETFREDSDMWTLDTGRNAARTIGDGVLTIRVDEDSQLSWSTLDTNYADFYLEVDTAHVAGPVDNLLGVVFRMEDAENFYLFMISSDGAYSLGKYVADKWFSLVAWESTDAIETGAGGENRLGLLAADNEMALYINNEELTRVQDDSFAAGQIALLAGTNDEAGVEVAFDNVWLWTKASTQTGAISRKSVKPTATATPRKSAPRSDATVKSATLNVRGGPSTAYSVVATLKQGDAVRIIGRSADSQWVKIELAGQSQAWVSTSLLNITVDLTKVAVAAAPAPPPTPRPAANVAYLVIENHIGRYITMQVNDQNFRVEGKVGNTPGTYRFILQGTGRYRIAAQLPNAGSHNFDLYVEATKSACTGRQGCVALGETFTQTYY